MAEPFHLGIGGPLYRLERAAGIDRPGRLVAALIAVTWIPLILLAAAQWPITGQLEPLLRDLSIHARLLVALPLLLGAERLLDRTCAVTVGRLFDEGYVPPASVARLRALLDRVARWRDAALPESILLAVALLVGLASLTGLLPPAGALGGLIESRYDPVRIWYGLVSLPLFQFVMWRSLYRWALWVRVLVGVSRVPLRLLPAHADQRAGIGFLKLPNLAYCVAILPAVSSVLCAGWATQIWTYGAHLDTFKPLFFAYMLVGVLIAVAPLLLFVPQLFRARLVGEEQYGALVSDYTLQFHERWIDRADRADLLGTPHIQSLADLGTSYRANIEQMRVLLFTSADLIALFVATFVPALPLMFLQGPAHEVIHRILKLVVGGMPH
jgi:hypothetical protein